MFIRISKLSKTKLILIPLLLLMLWVTKSDSDPIIENEVEDLNILLSQFIGTTPNVVTILDLSGSMGRNFGGDQIGDWDVFSALDFCKNERCGSSCGNSTERRQASHCAEVIANTNVCGFTCREGRCELQDEIEDFEACVIEQINLGNVDPSFTLTSLQNVFSSWCGGTSASSCSGDPSSDRVAAANEIGNESGLALCGSQSCNFTCNTSSEYSNFTSCMQDLDSDITTNGNVIINEPNCSATDIDGNQIIPCAGTPEFGSARMDVALSVFMDILDADNSLESTDCNDPGQLFDGTNSTISCQNYMFTPFRDVEDIVLENSNLPTLPSSSSLRDQLTIEDSDALDVRFRAMSYAGVGNGSGCTASFRMDSSFTTDYRSVWDFYRDQAPQGGTPLARIIGIDDTNGGTWPTDAINAFANELNSDPAVECRPQFIIVITDGDDSCSGDCDFNNSSCTGSSAASNNANRRSSIQAVSNVRTRFARTQVQGIKKEVIVFVIGLGINNPITRNALHGMAIAGGTHTRGIIKHIDPASGIEIGTVNVEAIDPATNATLDPDDQSVLPGSTGDSLDVFRALARADQIDTNPSNAHLTGCMESQADINGHCHLSNVDIFDNTFFDSTEPFVTAGVNLEDFAFLVNTTDELVAAFQNILSIIEGFTTTGTSPGAPQSSTSIALRDRIFLSILTPLTDQRFWQGRLALYGFVDDPGNIGSKIVVRDPQGTDLTTKTSQEIKNGFGIFDQTDGDLIPAQAQQYHWEAAKILAERDIAANPRRIFTPDRDFDESTSVDKSVQGVIRYLDDNINFDSSLDIDFFDIQNADVVLPLPGFCLDSSLIRDCNDGTTDAGANANCDDDLLDDGLPNDSHGEMCRQCIKECLRDKIVDYMSGNTEIEPVLDDLGDIGIDCPDEDTGSLDQCSVRLGDVFHSDPVVVGSPSPLFFDTGFQVFGKAYIDRSSAVYVGANDGGMHSFHAGELINPAEVGNAVNPFTGAATQTPFFDEGTGWEMFFFIPPTFLPDSIAPSTKSPRSHLINTFSSLHFTPDFRFGDFKTFVIDNEAQRSFFDGSPLIFDAWIDGYDNAIKNSGADALCNIDNNNFGGPDLDGQISRCGNEWHTLLISGLRNGGGAFTALDITNPKCTVSSGACSNISKFSDSDGNIFTNGAGPEYPTHLWTLFDQDFGNTWSKPVSGRVRMKTSNVSGPIIVDRWVVFAGGGLDPTDLVQTDNDTGNTVDPGADTENFGNAFYAIDAATGKIIYKFHPVRHIPSSFNTNQDDDVVDTMQCSMAAETGVFDLNADGYVDIAYIGDTCGRLWRFDVSTPIEDTGNDISQTGKDGNAIIEAPDWTASIAFCTNTDSECGTTEVPLVPQNNLEPIYFAPTSVFDDIGRNHVIFLTGDRRDPSNINLIGRLYNFIDNYLPAFLASGNDGDPITTDMKTLSDFMDNNLVIDLVEQSGADDPTLQFTVSDADVAAVGGQGEFAVNFPDNVIVNAGDVAKGEKGIGTPVVVNRVLIFTTFVPGGENETNPCLSGSSGIGRVFGLDFITGAAALGRIPGAAPLISGDDNTVSAAAGLSIAEGIPSPARLTFGARGSVIMAVSFAGGAVQDGETLLGAQFLIWELPPFPTRTQTLFWEEVL